MSTSRPADLIPVLEAAGLIDRSLTTVRAWVRAGSVTGYRETEAPNGRLLVSRAEILAYAVSSGLSIEPGRRPSPDAPPSEASPSPTAAPPDRYFDAVLEAHRSAVAALEARCADLRHDVQDWKDRATAAEAEAAALRELLRAEQGRSLWSRLLGTSKVSALPDG